MKKIILFLSSAIILNAHFGVTLPSSDIVEDQQNSNISLKFAFMHPFEQSYMHLAMPEKVGVFFDGKTTDISKTLEQKDNFFLSKYTLNEPGVYQFFMQPKPYFEPSEAKFITHLTKTIVEGFGGSDGWDVPIGLKAEIVPLTRPYGLYEGNVFSAKVLYKSKPAKHVEVEVELYNEDNFKAPTSTHITQVVKTDENGIFTFAMPKSGWWGFAALIEDDEKLNHENKSYPIELGAVLWVKAYKWQK